MHSNEVVITGMGILCPLGSGPEAFWSALVEGRSGIRRLPQLEARALPVRIGAEINGFEPRAYIANRKSLKLMSRDAQLGVAASTLACRDAGLAAGIVDPGRFGVVLGADRICTEVADYEAVPYRKSVINQQFDFNRWANEAMSEGFPLMFLTMLPNMIASHIAIAQDARGPNNTIHHAEASSLLAMAEAVRTIQRGAADVMLAGGASSQMKPVDWIRHCIIGILSPRQDEPEKVMRPFDARRDGQVWGEGAAVLVLESRRHAEARGARILARILAYATTGQPRANGRAGGWTGLARAMTMALEGAALQPAQLGHVNAHGLSTIEDDRVEAQALAQCVPDVPVFAAKSYFGNLGAAGGTMEMAASILALNAGLVPATLNYQWPDADCPVRVIREPLQTARPTVLKVSWTSIGQAAAVVLGSPD